MGNNHIFKLTVLFMLLTMPTYAGDLYKAPPEVIPMLPIYCLGQYVPNVPPDDPDRFIRGCGEYANHYCPGLVNMKVAERERNLDKKMYELSQAQGNMEYTLHYTNDIPDCFLRPRAQLYLERIKLDIQMLRIQMKSRRR